MKYKQMKSYLTSATGLLLALLSAVLAADSLVIKQVSVNTEYFQAGDQPVAIRFNINQDAHVSVVLYDARNYRLRTLINHQRLTAGNHSVSWNGLDEQRNSVPGGFYHYTITATDNKGKKVVYDLTDITGGETVAVSEVSYDAESESVHYELSNTGRVFLRTGVEGAFITRTLLNGVVRKAGKHSVQWDGWDRSHVINLKHHPRLTFVGDGYRPSRNTIVVLNSQKNTQPQWLPLPSRPDTDRQAVIKPRRLNIHAYHNPEHCRDVEVTLTLPDHLPRENGIPVISKPVALRVSLSNDDMLRMEAERGEVVFFLDNQLLYENEASFFPYTWTWNKPDSHEGIHYLTGFVLGFEKHFGVSTLKVKLNNADNNND